MLEESSIVTPSEFKTVGLFIVIILGVPSLRVDILLFSGILTPNVVPLVSNDVN